MKIQMHIGKIGQLEAYSSVVIFSIQSTSSEFFEVSLKEFFIIFGGHVVRKLRLIRIK